MTLHIVHCLAYRYIWLMCNTIRNEIFTAHVAKRAKVMFSQVFVILSPKGGGREGGVNQGII